MATLAERFRTVDGADSESDKIYNAMLDVAPGQVLTYGDLDRILGRDFRADRTPYYTALKRVEKRQAITFRTIARHGFQRIALGDDLVDHVKNTQGRARRQASKAVDRSMARTDVEMSEAVRKELDRLNEGLSAVKSALTSQRRKVAALERKVENNARSALTQEDVQRMIEEALKS